MKYIGIWLDKDKAHVVTLMKEHEKMKTIESNIEHFHPAGGSGTKAKGGPQDVVQDSKYLEREKHQHKTYFKSIVPHLKGAHSLAIFGPAQTGERLAKHLENYNHMLFMKLKGVEKADSMTLNQVKAMVRDYFGIQNEI
ncbi:MAG: hypothetical protein KJN68_12610 [Bacteroidia bacterium]|nr:hypothetical protein [Bacteroidia bacterium]